MIEIHLFEQLAAFADCGTLSAVAEQLPISQPAGWRRSWGSPSSSARRAG